MNASGFAEMNAQVELKCERLELCSLPGYLEWRSLILEKQTVESPEPLYNCMANLTVYLLNISNLRRVDRHLRYPGKLRRRPWVEAMNALMKYTKPEAAARRQGLTLVHFSA